MIWLRIFVPLIAVVAVFGVGVMLDGPDLRGEDWTWFLTAGVLLPAFLLALAGGGIAFGVVCIRGARRHDRPSAWDERPMFDDPHMGYLSAVGAFVMAAVFLIVVGVLVGISPPHVQNGHISVMSLWLVTALGVGAFALLVLIGWGHRRTWIGRGLLVVAVAAVAVSVWQAGSWWRCWEATRYEWYKDRAFAAGWKTDEQKAARRYWAERMIAHRPDDWRGYAERVGTYDLGADGDAVVSDIETALPLGCNDPSTRAVFGEKLSNLGRFVEAAREYDAAANGYTAARKDHWERDADWCAVHAAGARLDAGDLNAVSEWAAARRRADPNDTAATFFLARVHIARGESVAACDLLRPLNGKPLTEDGSWQLAWVLATCLDAAVRDGSRAAAIIDEYLAKIEQALRDDGMPRSGYRPLDEVLAEVKREAQPARVAALAEAGKLDEARVVFDQWKKDEGWDRHPHHNGFWVRRYARLDACLREGKPYRDEPEK